MAAVFCFETACGCAGADGFPPVVLVFVATLDGRSPALHKLDAWFSLHRCFNAAIGSWKC